MGVIATIAGVAIKLSTLISVASMAYQISQSIKMRKAAKDAAEARKGFEVVVESSSQPIPIVYGRAKIGGIRVWHNTKATNDVPVNYTTTADKIFDIAGAAIQGKILTFTATYISTSLVSSLPTVGELGVIYTNTNTNISYVWDGSSFTTNYTLPVEYDNDGNPYTPRIQIFKDTPGIPSNSLRNPQEGEKNDFLYFQQVLCHGPINKVVDFVIDDDRYADDPTLGAQTAEDRKAAFTTEIHYDGSQANPLAYYNFSDRNEARFPGIAYATTAIRLNRSEPQFSGQVPSIQYFIEGRKVRTVSAGVLSTARIYSNNPAWCLLDYLLDSSDRKYTPVNSTERPLFETGKGITADEIDLPSFESAAALIESKTVLSNKPVYGNIWQSTDGSTNILTRNIKLYECNLIVDTSKPLRENVEAILSTMGDARLVWSQGKYKLRLQYPESNAQIQLSATITDDDIVQGSSIKINWPSASERLNNAIVKFSNESENFKEDSVSWPPKTSGTTYRGIGGKSYPASNTPSSRGPSKLLSSFGVWSGSAAATTLTWKFRALVSGVHNVKLQIDDNGNISIANVNNLNNPIFNLSISNGWDNEVSGNVTLTANEIYQIIITANNISGEYGAAATITKDNSIYWTTRDPAYSSFEVNTTSNSVYQTMLTEDNNIELETSIFYEGCVDYYHALAKAEELVRTSRSAVGVSFDYIVKDKFLEPGDFIKLDSTTLGVSSDFYIRINEVKLKEGGICEISGSRFDYTQLAWNVLDTEYVKARNLYNFEIPAPRSITYEPSGEFIQNSSGKLRWDSAEFDGFSSYIVYANTITDFDSVGQPVFKEIGRTTDVFFNLPALNVRSARFGVRSFSKSNRSSAMTTTGNIAIELIAPVQIVEIIAPKTIFMFPLNFDPLTSPPLTPISLKAKATGYLKPVYKWYLNDVLIPNENSYELIIQPFNPGLTRRYKVEANELNAPNDIYEAIDIINIYSIKDGNSITFKTSNDSITLPASSDGVVSPGYLPFTIDTEVFVGITKVPYNKLILDIDPTSCSATINPNTGVVTITAIDDPFADIVLTAVLSGFSESTDGVVVNANITIALALAGVSATSRLARIKANRLAFIQFSNTTNLTPNSITVTDISTGYETPTRRWYIDNVLQVNETASTLIVNSFPLNETRTIKLEIEDLNNTYLSEDSVTLYSIKEGDDSFNIALNDISRTVAANSNGDVLPAYFPFSVETIVARGVEIITSSASITYSIDSISNITATINSSTGVLQVTGMNGGTSITQGYARIKAIIPNGPTLYTTFNIAKAIAGLNSKSVRIEASGYVFNKDSNNVIIPNQIITLAANKQNTTAVANWSTTPSMALYNAATGGSETTTGDIVYLRGSTFNTANSVKITVICNDVTDSTTVVDLRDGQDAVEVVLSNPIHQFPVSPLNVIDFNNSGTTIKVFEGLTPRIITAVTATGTNITPSPRDIVDGLNTTTVTVSNFTGISQPTGSVNYLITFIKGDGTNGTVEANQSFVKGVPGASGTSAVSIVYTNDSLNVPVSEGIANWTASGGILTVYDGVTPLSLNSVSQNNTTPSTNGFYNLDITKVSGSTLGEPSLTINGTSTILSEWSGTLSVITTYRLTAYVKTTTGQSIQISTDINLRPSSDPIIYYLTTSSPIINKAAPDAATAGQHTAITIQGKKVIGQTTSNFGWVTVTPNGGTEAALATDTSSTPLVLAPSDTDGKTSYTVKLYNQATVSSAVLLDSEIINVIFGISGAASAGPRTIQVYFYYTTASATAPTGPSPAQLSYNFSTNTASSSNASWTQTFSAPAQSTNTANNKYWAVLVTFAENTFEGTQKTPVITSVFNWLNFDGLVTFTNLSQGRNASGALNTTFIDGGSIIANTLTVDSIKSGTTSTNNGLIFGLGASAALFGEPGVVVGRAVGGTNTTGKHGACFVSDVTSGFGLLAGASGPNSYGLGVYHCGNTSYNTYDTGIAIGNKEQAIYGKKTNVGLENKVTDFTLGTSLFAGAFAYYNAPGTTLTASKYALLAGSTYSFNGLGDMYVTGSIFATNNVVGYSSSDRRYKTNVKVLKNSLYKINLVEGVSFKWNKKFLEAIEPEFRYLIKENDIGVIAQQVQKIFPELVNKDSNNKLTVNYPKFVPILIEAIKELTIRLEELERKVNAKL